MIFGILVHHNHKHKHRLKASEHQDLHRKLCDRSIHPPLDKVNLDKSLIQRKPDHYRAKERAVFRILNPLPHRLRLETLEIVFEPDYKAEAVEEVAPPTILKGLQINHGRMMAIHMSRRHLVMVIPHINREAQTIDDMHTLSEHAGYTDYINL